MSRKDTSGANRAPASWSAKTFPPYRGIEVRGRARIQTEGAHEAALRLAVRYLGEEEGAAYAEQAADDRLIRLEPGRLRAWDFADEY